MEVKQSKVSAFFIDNVDLHESLAYIEKNAPLLKSYLLVFSQPIQEELQQRCDTWALAYVYNQGQLKNKRSKEQKSSGSESKKPLDTAETKITSVAKKEILRTIRSGETITHKGDLLISGNVNDGATISSEGTMAIFGIVSGDISCNGSYLIVSELHRGKVIFQGEVINEMITGSQLKMFYKEDETIKIKELT
jgi:septum site-determining protein MinC